MLLLRWEIVHFLSTRLRVPKRLVRKFARSHIGVEKRCVGFIYLKNQWNSVWRNLKDDLQGNQPYRICNLELTLDREFTIDGFFFSYFIFVPRKVQHALFTLIDTVRAYRIYFSINFNGSEL